jgi:hypothetical protein
MVSVLAALALWWPSAAPPADAVVAEVAGARITVSEVLRRRRAATPEAHRAALAEALKVRLLALEAPTVLGPQAAGLSPDEAAAAVLAALFDPGRRCLALPEPLLRQRYAETRWRFVAPPAWTVDDLQLLCCRDPRRCGSPQVAACLAANRPRIEALRAGLPDRLTDLALRAHVDALAGRPPDLFLKRYTFYFDPDHPEAPVDRRLQTVDRVVAEAVAATPPGAVAPLVESRFGHHILRVHARRPGIALPYADPRTQALLRTEACPFFLVAQRDQYLADLAAQTPSRVDRAVLEALTGPLKAASPPSGP